MKKTVSELQEEAINFALKPEVWRLDDEIPPDATTVRYAIEWIERACALDLDVEVFPGAEDSIFIAAMEGDMTCDIEVCGSDIASLELQKGIGAKYDILKALDHPSREEVDEILVDLAGRGQRGAVGMESHRQETVHHCPAKISNCPFLHTKKSEKWSCTLHFYPFITY